jgi:RNA polymerase sigma-70 factor (ECF subfamily)
MDRDENRPPLPRGRLAARSADLRSNRRSAEDRSDAALLDRWTAGDSEAGSELIGRHLSAVQAYVRSRSRVDVEDIVQDTLTACVASAPRFRGDSEFRTFLLGIANHLLMSAKRARFKAASNAEGAGAFVDSSPRFGEERDHVLTDAMGRLSPELKTAIALSYWAGLTEHEIARRLGCPRGTVASRIRRGLERLRELLGDEIETCSS